VSTDQQPLQLDQRIQEAIVELQNAIRQEYPSASFAVARAPDDPDSIHLNVIVDVDDLDEVGDLVVDRVVNLIAEEGIPVHVIPLHTPDRLRADLRARQSGRRARRAIPILRQLP
jgi:hypothetical protein